MRLRTCATLVLFGSLWAACTRHGTVLASADSEMVRAQTAEAARITAELFQPQGFMARISHARTPSGPARKHFLAAAVLIQQEASYLPEWLEHHLLPQIGVSHFFLYDDNSPDRGSLNAVLQPYVASGVVTLHALMDVGPIAHSLYHESPVFCKPSVARTLPSQTASFTGADGSCRRQLLFPQQPAMIRHVIQTHGSEVEWLALVDIDEFLHVTPSLLQPSGGSFAGALRRIAHPGVGGVHLSDTVMVPPFRPNGSTAARPFVIETTAMALKPVRPDAECTDVAQPSGICRLFRWNAVPGSRMGAGNASRYVERRMPRGAGAGELREHGALATGAWPASIMQSSLSLARVCMRVPRQAQTPTRCCMHSFMGALVCRTGANRA